MPKENMDNPSELPVCPEGYRNSRKGEDMGERGKSPEKLWCQDICVT
jgi:hypothetical protein